MTFKHKSFISFILLQTWLSASFANDKKVIPQDSPYFKTGFYSGALVGYTTDKLFNSNYYDGSTDGGATQEEMKRNPTSNTFTGELVFGGRILLNNGFMPGFDITLSSMRSKWEMDFPYRDLVALGNPPLHVRVEKLYTVTPALVLGAIVNERYYIFTKIGLNISRMKTEITDYESRGGKHGQSEFLLGLSASLGLEYAINNNWSITGLFSYETSRASEYVSRTYQPRAALFYDDINYNKIRTVTYTQKIGIVYKF